MDRAAVFVDAGYLFASGGKLFGKERLHRSDLRLDHDAVLKVLRGLCAEITGLPLLRIYWYDGASGAPTPQQAELSYRPGVKLRLGLVTPEGQQEGVDDLLVADLVELAQNRALVDALLMTGDDDIRVGMQQAQRFGVRVHLLGIAPTLQNQSRSLAQEADTTRELSQREVESFLSLSVRGPGSARTSPSTETSPLGVEALDRIAAAFAASLGSEEAKAVFEGAANTATLPPQIDRQLLIEATKANAGTALSVKQKHRLRAAFLRACGGARDE